MATPSPLGRGLTLHGQTLRFHPPGQEAAVELLVGALPTAALEELIRWLLEQHPNPSTRRAYASSVGIWLAWCAARGVQPTAPDALHAAAWRDELSASSLAASTVRQRLSALRGLYNHWVTRGLLEAWQHPFLMIASPPPERAAHGGGLTPLLPDEALKLLLPYPARPGSLVAARDQVLLGLLYFAVLRRREAVELCVRGQRSGAGRRPGLLRDRDGLWIWTARKRSKWQEIPTHPHLQQYLTTYLRMAGLADDHEGPLLRPWGRGGFKRESLRPNSLYAVVRRRFREVGVQGSPQSLRASALTRYLKAGGELADAQQLAAHGSSDTTALYARYRERFKREDLLRLTP